MRKDYSALHILYSGDFNGGEKFWGLPILPSLRCFVKRGRPGEVDGCLGGEEGAQLHCGAERVVSCESGGDASRQQDCYYANGHHGVLKNAIKFVDISLG